ncbi:uncharacterized protein ACWYII_005929 [Salvelinus alpinus]
MLLKVLAEKQGNFIEQEGASLFQAEARLEELLQDRAQQLRESQGQIAALSNLSDTQLIQESRLVEVPRMKDILVDVTLNLQEMLSGVTDVLATTTTLECCWITRRER